MATLAGAGEERTVILPDPLPSAASLTGDPAAPAARRIEALDFVRGIALFGILLMNIIGYGLPDAYSNPTNSGGATGANLWVWIVGQITVEGTQRALFSMLFGASTILLTSRLEAAGRTDVADIYFRRNLWLIALGFVHAFLFLWYGDILFAYGVIALFIFPFRKMAPRALFGIGIAALLLGALWNGYESYDLMRKHDAAVAAEAARASGTPLTVQQDYAVAVWQSARTVFEVSPESVRAAVEARTNGYWRAFRHIAELNVHWQTWGLYRYFFDAFGMMLIGMALYKIGVLTLERPRALYGWMMAGGYAVGLVVNALETRWIIDHQFSAVAFAQANVTYDVGRLAMSVGHLGALLLFVRSGLLGFLRRAVAAVGQMAVTNYMMQSAVGAVLFMGLGWFNQLERYQLYYVVLAICAAQLVISPLWLRFFRFGPVEWLWRTLTYMKWQPMRRRAAAPA